MGPLQARATAASMRWHGKVVQQDVIECGAAPARRPAKGQQQLSCCLRKVAAYLQQPVHSLPAPAPDPAVQVPPRNADCRAPGLAPGEAVC